MSVQLQGSTSRFVKIVEDQPEAELVEDQSTEQSGAESTDRYNSFHLGWEKRIGKIRSTYPRILFKIISTVLALPWLMYEGFAVAQEYSSILIYIIVGLLFVWELNIVSNLYVAVRIKILRRSIIALDGLSAIDRKGIRSQFKLIEKIKGRVNDIILFGGELKKQLQQ